MTPEARVQDVLRRLVAPALDLDGAAIVVLGVSGGIATVRLGPICASCPAALTTVIGSVEQELRRHLPDIEVLEAVL